MRLLIFGVTGMLGNALFRTLRANPQHETWGTLRGELSREAFPEADRRYLLSGVDVLNDDAVVAALSATRPDTVINCVGVIKQLAIANDPLIVLPINAMFPHKLAGLCALAGARMIQLSSDCIYSGRAGNYVETDLADAEDLYGKSKYIGEVHDQTHVVTLRTSGIGHELRSSNGLLEWFLSQNGQVKGFAKAIYSGLPSVELARVIDEFVLSRPELHGLYHVSAGPISKLDLLTLVAEVYGKKITIERDDAVAIDRSLDSRRFREATGYVPADWPELIAMMHDHRPQTADFIHV
jgi:dTDP-4-dehydrorhamnose reductase